MKGLNLGTLYYFAYWDEKGGKKGAMCDACELTDPLYLHHPSQDRGKSGHRNTQRSV